MTETRPPYHYNPLPMFGLRAAWALESAYGVAWDRYPVTPFRGGYVMLMDPAGVAVRSVGELLECGIIVYANEPPSETWLETRDGPSGIL
jgi:hypothetical protein